MGDSSITVHVLPSTASPVAASLTKLLPNARIGMQREVYEAAESGSMDVLRWHNNWKQERTAMGNNVLHVHMGKPLEGIRKRVVTDSLSMSFVRYVVDETSENSALLQSNNMGDTPLHFAARFGHTGAVQEFLTRSEVINAGLLNKTNNIKDTALHNATRAGHAGIVVSLVEAGGTDALHHMPNDLAETPLLLAAERGCFKSFTAIVAHISFSAFEHKGPCGQTALHLAVLHGNKDIVDQILQIDTSSLLIRVKNDQGQTPLHCCAAQNVRKQHTIFKVLLDHDDEYNSTAYVQDNEGRTPLHIATLNLNFDAAKMLIDSYPDCIEMVDNKGQNAAHFAANLGCLNAFEQFLDSVPRCDRFVNEKDNNGNTPLHLLVATTPTLPVHSCFNWLPFFLKWRINLDVRAFNNKNLTAGDVIASNDGLHHLVPRSCAPNTYEILPKGKRIPNMAEVVDRAKKVGNVEKKKGNPEIIEERMNHLRKVGETRLIVAALIATVSFTAGFTLPGGFDQSPGKTIGLAVLVKKTSFKAFLISDTIAFTMSSLAVICYFALANHNDLASAETVSTQAHFLNSISLIALMIAFVTGINAVVSQTTGLGLIILAISLFYFYFSIVLLLGSCRHMWTLFKRTAHKCE